MRENLTYGLKRGAGSTCLYSTWKQKHGVETEQKHVPNRPTAGRIGSSSGGVMHNSRIAKQFKIASMQYVAGNGAYYASS